MHIPVKCSCGECQDWAIVELQGSFEIQNAAIVQNLAIGSLCRSSEKVYKFVIGYHELEGTKVPLKKPMVIMKKVKLDDQMEVDSVPLAAASLEMKVVGVVRHKLLFKNRPKAIISSVRHQMVYMECLLQQGQLGSNFISVFLIESSSYSSSLEFHSGSKVQDHLRPCTWKPKQLPIGPPIHYVLGAIQVESHVGVDAEPEVKKKTVKLYPDPLAA